MTSAYGMRNGWYTHAGQKRHERLRLEVASRFAVATVSARSRETYGHARLGAAGPGGAGSLRSKASLSREEEAKPHSRRGLVIWDARRGQWTVSIADVVTAHLSTHCGAPSRKGRTQRFHLE